MLGYSSIARSRVNLHCTFFHHRLCVLRCLGLRHHQWRHPKLLLSLPSHMTQRLCVRQWLIVPICLTAKQRANKSRNVILHFWQHMAKQHLLAGPVMCFDSSCPLVLYNFLYDPLCSSNEIDWCSNFRQYRATHGQATLACWPCNVFQLVVPGGFVQFIVRTALFDIYMSRPSSAFPSLSVR